MSSRNQWFEGKRYGLFAHYLAAPAGNSMERDIGVSEWNRRVDAFDTKVLACQIREAGADYVGITIGQNSGYYCSPNRIYEELTEAVPGKCSRRDLVADLSKELAVYGIDLLAYLPSGAPDCDSSAMERLEWHRGADTLPESAADGHTDDRQAAFQRKWQRIIEEWSGRWGTAVKGWWIDGCYYSDRMYLHKDEPNFLSFASALRSGNPDSVLAFNTGLEDPFALESDESDYTAGEVGTTLPLAAAGSDSRDVITDRLKGKKLHILSYLGSTWGAGTPRMPSGLAAGYTRYINDRNGIVTWDIPLSYDGTLSPEWQQYLAEFRTALDT